MDCTLKCMNVDVGACVSHAGPKSEMPVFGVRGQNVKCAGSEVLVFSVQERKSAGVHLICARVARGALKQWGDNRIEDPDGSISD